MQFVDRFNELLKSREITAYRLSIDAGIPQTTISGWKNGQNVPSGKYLEKLAKYFNVSTDVLLYGTDGHSSGIANPEPPALTDEEVELLSYFRALGPSGRRRVLVFAEDQKNAIAEKGTDSTAALA